MICLRRVISHLLSTVIYIYLDIAHYPIHSKKLSSNYEVLLVSHSYLKDVDYIHVHVYTCLCVCMHIIVNFLTLFNCGHFNHQGSEKSSKFGSRIVSILAYTIELTPVSK